MPYNSAGRGHMGHNIYKYEAAHCLVFIKRRKNCFVRYRYVTACDFVFDKGVRLYMKSAVYIDLVFNVHYRSGKCFRSQLEQIVSACNKSVLVHPEYLRSKHIAYL